MPEISIISLCLIALDVYAITLAVTRSQGVERTLAWVFAILAAPGVGALAYLALANPSVRRTTRRKRRKAEVVRAAVAKRAGGLENPGSKLERSILELIASLTGILPTSGGEVELLVKDEMAFDQICGAIESARETIWAEYYVIRNDETGHRFLELLAEKASDGVRVRLLYDAVGSLEIDAGRLAAIESAGGRVEPFLPVNPLRRRWSLHLRNHRKLVIVDGETAFTGGMNVGDEYSGRSRRKGDQYFHDTHLALRGTAVRDLAQVFAEDWSFATGESIPLPPERSAREGRHTIVAVVPSGPDQQFNANAMAYFAGIATARKTVYLTSPYFIPDEPTISALVCASMRGVDVRLLLPARCDVPLVGPAARSYYPKLVAAGVRVFEYLPSMLHAKTLVVDGRWGIVGSANVDVRSFRLNFELGALVIDDEFAARLEARFMNDVGQSREVTEDDLEGRGFVARLGYGAARLLSPLL